MALLLEPVAQPRQTGCAERGGRPLEAVRGELQSGCLVALNGSGDGSDASGQLLQEEIDNLGEHVASCVHPPENRNAGRVESRVQRDGSRSRRHGGACVQAARRWMRAHPYGVGPRSLPG